jgi:hypothetical protein
MTQVYNGLTEQEKREVRMYGVTEAGMRKVVGERLKRTTPTMMVASLLSDVQEIINTEYGEVDFMRAEDARQVLNRAKFILFEYSEQDVA